MGVPVICNNAANCNERDYCRWATGEEISTPIKGYCATAGKDVKLVENTPLEKNNPNLIFREVKKYG